jgi:hypothetical protein
MEHFYSSHFLCSFVNFSGIKNKMQGEGRPDLAKAVGIGIKWSHTGTGRRYYDAYRGTGNGNFPGVSGTGILY